MRQANPEGEAAIARWMVVAIGALALAFAIVVYGGYRLGWTWTGFADNGTVWAWLGLLILPTVLTLLPLWYRTRRSLHVEWRGGAVLLGATAIVLLVGGYGLGWRFTGFQGKTLWDWLDLLVLPFALSLLPVSLESSWSRFREARRAITAVGFAFGTLVVLGYALDWHWTGFRGNTFWDWLHLLLVPFLLPASVTWLSVRARSDRQQAVQPEVS
jgi:hypothetical protein